VLDHEHVRRFESVDAGSVFRLETGAVERLTPPLQHVRLAQPLFEEREIRPAQTPERNRSRRARHE